MKQYDVKGMSCAACSARVESAVSKIENVTSCSVNLLTNSMTVEGTASDTQIISAVRKAGYDAAPKGKTKTDKADGSQFKKLKTRLISSIVLLIILMYFSMFYTMFGFPLPAFFEASPVAVATVQLILTVAIAVINRSFFINGFKGLFHLSPNMDSLVAIGSATAFIYSTVQLIMMTSSDIPEHFLHEMYFESAGMILTLITLGKMLESYSKGKTTNALKDLMSLAPETATVIIDGEETAIDIENVRIGDIFIVRPGERIPVDGEVIEGESSIDESSLTGESMPSDKSCGDTVKSGTMNITGFLKCRAERVGEDTALAKIIQTVSDASATKAPIAKTADKVAGVFVPVVIAIALVTTAVWLIVGKGIGFSLARGISVLVISCPCALGLATPVAIMVGNGVGAKNGILFKNAEMLEIAGRVKTVVFDKTGTLTKGESTVTDIIPNGVTSRELLKTAYSLEIKSEHPLKQAIVRKAEEEGITAEPVTGFEAVFGKGVSGDTDGKKTYGGNLKYIETVAEITEETVIAVNHLSDEGKTPLLFALDGEMIGIIALADEVKSDSADCIAELKRMGIKTAMLSGDNERTAKEIGRKVGIDEIIAGILPEEKSRKVSSYKADGKVMMIGDGINDAPALTSADVGVAIGAGTDIAIDSAGIVLINSRPYDVVTLIRLSRNALRNIKQNLFWAFFYNSLGIPIAAGVFIPLFGWQLSPMIAAAAMSLSSVFVVCNALRLNFFKAKNPSVKTHNGGQAQIKTNTISEEKIMKEKTMKIEGMMCIHCESRVKKCLESFPQVEKAEVSHEKGTAVMKLNGDIEDSVLKAAVENEGYKVL